MKIPRGTYDLFSNEMRIRNYVINDLKKITESYMFEMIETPMFESTELFKRSVGEQTDVVNKEMYTFEDKKGRSMTLRPELTAPIARCFIENKLYATAPNSKFYYYQPAFRYERPQSGRFRQFYQFGVEHYGETSSSVDSEVISLAYNLFKHFGLENDIILKINSIGKTEDRKSYCEQLKTYLNSNKNELCTDCLNRIETNPLRVLDCKTCSTKDVLINSPKIDSFINEDSKQHFNDILTTLKLLKINYIIDFNLVRGLDYYNDTVFEFVHTESNITVCGGGRYDNLISQLSNNSSPAFGFGLGVERLEKLILAKHQMLEEQLKPECDVYYMPLCNEAFDLCLSSTNKLRYEGLVCMMPHSVKSIKSNIKSANLLNAIYAVIIGDTEIESGLVTIKNLDTREEMKVKLSDFEDELIKNGGSHEHE